MQKLLSTIRPGQHVTVANIQDSNLKPKLMEMGLVIGREIEVLFCAPLGDPIAIDVQGYVLSLRLEEAALIQVNIAGQSKDFS
ncbi:MAG: ferrous iron transport protein A [Crocinitomicaceae bacterium]|nr:ferrous iron transport protein A [Crocinitomicaceae bacterium]